MSTTDNDEMREEYDFRGKEGVRGKYYRALQEGRNTVIHKSDGSTVVMEARPVFLESDVQKYFPNSEAVNKALRGLIELVPERDM